MNQTSKIKLTLKNILTNAFKNSFKTIFFMMKIIIPVTFIVMLLQYLDILKYITILFEPFMKFFGLPGDAALVLITANLINIYGALAVMTSLSFTVKEVTILAVMILFSHSLLVESAIIKRLNVPIKKQLLIRLSAAIFSGLVLNLLLGNKYGEIAFTSLKPLSEIPKISFSSFDLFSIWLKALLSNYIQTIVKSLIDLVWIISSILFGLEILKEFKILDKLNQLLYHLTRHLGLSKSATSMLVIGFFIGPSYVAGAILIQYKEGKMTKRDITIVTTFLLLCHAIIEDSLLFIRYGALPWIVIIYKITFTISATYLFNLILNKKEPSNHEHLKNYIP